MAGRTKTARTKQEFSIDKDRFFEAISELRELGRIDMHTISKLIEDVIYELLREKYNIEDPSELFDVMVNPDRGDIEIWKKMTVVKSKRHVKDPEREIPISQARKIEPEIEVGEPLYIRMSVSELFDRRMAARARELLHRKIEQSKRQKVYERYRDRIGELVTGEVYQVLPTGDVILLDEDRIELFLPAGEQIANDRFRKGDLVRAVIKQVRMTRSGPAVIVSRVDPRFLAKLLEHEITEVMDGIIKILKVVRVPGKRAKVLVQSLDDRVDPVGAIVGVRGSRIRNIVRELKGEAIDIVPYTSDPALLIARALEPAEVNLVELDENKRYARVYMNADQVSLAIGKEGLNIKLASKLTGYEIEVFREKPMEPGDKPLKELKEELGEAVVNAFEDAGITSIKDVLDYSMDDLKKLVDLDPELVEEAVEKIVRIHEQTKSQ